MAKKEKVLEIINKFKVQLKTVANLRTNARTQAEVGETNLAMYSQKKIAEIEESKIIKKAKSDFLEVLFSIKLNIIKQGKEKEFPEIIGYDYGYEAEVAYGHVLKIEEELQKM